jgi:hypothetical protein
MLSLESNGNVAGETDDYVGREKLVVDYIGPDTTSILQQI